MRGMPQKRRFPVGDREMDGVEIDFDPVREQWNEYELRDGGRFRMRLTVQRVYQLLDENGQPARDSEGGRMLIVQSQNQLITQD
jgi:hypothetical protein